MSRYKKGEKVIKQTATIEQPKEKRQYIQGATVLDKGIPCRHCGALYGHRVTNTYANGNRRRICSACGKPFIAVRIAEK